MHFFKSENKVRNLLQQLSLQYTLISLNTLQVCMKSAEKVSKGQFD